MRIHEEIYRMNTIGPLDTVARDLRLALRGIRRHDASKDDAPD